MKAKDPTFVCVLRDFLQSEWILAISQELKFLENEMF